MVENSNNFPDNLQRKCTEIYAEIHEIINGTRSVDELKGTGALSPKLRELVALGSAIANKRGRDTVVSCVADCLKAGASREQIFEAPAETYDTIVHDTIDAFENQH